MISAVTLCPSRCSSAFYANKDITISIKESSLSSSSFVFLGFLIIKLTT